MAATDNNDAPAIVNDGYHGGGGGGGFLQLRDRRLRLAVHVVAWAVAGIFSTITTTPGGPVTNPDHIMMYFLFLMAGVIFLLLSVVAADLPWAERAVGRLEDLFGAML